MTSKREYVTSTGLLLLRVGIGCLMLVHGVAKTQAFRDMSAAFPDPIGLGSKLSLILAIGAEVGCSTLLIVGFAARVASTAPWLRWPQRLKWSCEFTALYNMAYNAP